MTERYAGPDPGDWLRLSPWAVGFIFIRIIVDFVRNNLPMLAGAGAGVALIERIGLREVALAGLVIVLAVGLVCLIHHRRFRFRLDGDTLLVRRGIIERTELKVRAGRIQHLAIEQPLYLRLFGLVRLSVDTPGGAAAQVELPGIRADLAETLRARLAAAGEQAPVADGDAAAPVEDVLYRATTGGLILHGIASNYAYVLAAALAPFIGQLEPLARWLLADTALAETMLRIAQRPLVSGLLLALGLLVTLVAISVAVSLLRFHGFVLTRSNGRFRQRSGLINRQEQSLSRARLQSVEHVRTAIGRLLGRSHLICRQIGVVLPGRESSGRSFVIPGPGRAEADALVGVFWPGIDTDGDFRRVHRYYMRALLLRWSSVGALAIAAAVAGAGSALWLAAMPLVPALLLPFAWLRWRAVGYREHRGYIRVRRGLLGHRTTLFPAANVQRLQLRQSWLQRRRGVATLTLTLASGPVTIPCLTRTEADRMANLALYLAESGHADAAAPAH